MITIRLQRRGRKNDPSFRVIVVDSHKAAKTGSYLEMVGSYDPRVDRVALNAERITHWIKNGATVSNTVHNLLVSHKIIDGKKINVLPRKSPPLKEVSAEEVPAGAASEAVNEAPTEEAAPAAPAKEEEKKEEVAAEPAPAAEEAKPAEEEKVATE